jgi:hypothetical protein
MLFGHTFQNKIPCCLIEKLLHEHDEQFHDDEGFRSSSGCSHTIETISKSTATTNTRSLAISKVGLHCDRGLAGGLYIVIAPHHPHLKMGANTGSNNRNLHPQQVVSHPPFSSARPCTCKTNQPQIIMSVIINSSSALSSPRFQWIQLGLDHMWTWHVSEISWALENKSLMPLHEPFKWAKP